MESDTTALEASASLRQPTSTVSDTARISPGNAGYTAAVAAGAPDIHAGAGSDEETPLLTGRPTLGYAERRQSPIPDSESDGGRRQHSPPTWAGDVEFAGLPWYRSPSVFWLILPFLLYALTFGGTIVPGIEVITQLLCREKLIEQMKANGSNVSASPFVSLEQIPPDDPEFCSKDPGVQAAVAIFTLWGQVIGGVLSAITSPKLGSLSDRYGRRPFLALTVAGSLLKDACFILMFWYPEVFNVRWLLVAYAMDGLCGSFIVALALSHAYASDCTPPNKRSVRFGWFHGCFFVGIAVGPVAAGFAVEMTGHVVNLFYAALGLHIFFIVFVLLLVPESLSQSRQMKARERKAVADNVMAAEASRSIVPYVIRRGSEGLAFSLMAALQPPLLFLRRHNIFAPLKILYPTGPGTSPALRRNMLILALVDTTIFAVAMATTTIVIIYTKAAFGWDLFETSRYMSIANTTRVLVLVGVLPLITWLVRGRSGSSKAALKENGCDSLDLWLISVALLFEMLGFVGYALAPTGTVMIFSGMLASFGGMGSPTLQSSMTKHVPPDQIGEVLGATGLLHALARVFAPLVCNYIYARTVVVGMPTVVFFVLIAAFAVALTSSFFLQKGVYLDAQAIEEENERIQQDLARQDNEAEAS